MSNIDCINLTFGKNFIFSKTGKCKSGLQWKQTLSQMLSYCCKFPCVMCDKIILNDDN